MGKDNTVVQEEKTSLRMCIFVPSTVMSSWEYVAAVSCSCLTDAILQRIIGQARYYCSLVLLDKITNIIVRWLQVVPVCMDTSTVLIIACLFTSTLYANGTYPPVNTCSSMVFVLEHIWNNDRHQQHLITAVTLRDYLHWIIKSSLFVGWWYTWTYISLFIIIIHLLQNAVIYVPEVTLCMDTYCLDKLCSWSYIRAAATWCDWTHYTGGMF